MNFAHRREIVAAQIGGLDGVITTSVRHIRSALELDQDVRFIDRLHMEMMASLDLGPQWSALAAAPTIFVVDKEGHPQRPSIQTTEGRGK